MGTRVLDKVETLTPNAQRGHRSALPIRLQTDPVLSPSETKFPHFALVWSGSSPLKRISPAKAFDFLRLIETGPIHPRTAFVAIARTA